MYLWTFDPAVAVQPIVVTCYRKKFGRPSDRYRWRARSMGNGSQLCTPGQGFSSAEAAYENLALIWPPETTRHVVVKGFNEEVLDTGRMQ